MSCYKPRTAYRVEGQRKYSFRSDHPHIIEAVKVPCGDCIGCRRDRARSMSIRCVHEAKSQPGGLFNNVFVTLTYNDENLPDYGSLNVRDWQLFMKKLRAHYSRTKDPRERREHIGFYMGAEYGDNFGRPHYHAILFGLRPSDLKSSGKSKAGFPLYRSETLTELWGRGFVDIGDVTRESAEYVARYCMKKVNGPLAEAHYARVDPVTGEVYHLRPEFSVSSKRPGIGATWFDKFGPHCFNGDFVVLEGQQYPVPRFYDDLMARHDWLKLQEVKDRRVARANEPRQLADSTPERLKVREECAKARAKFYTGTHER